MGMTKFIRILFLRRGHLRRMLIPSMTILVLPEEPESAVLTLHVGRQQQPMALA